MDMDCGSNLTMKITNETYNTLNIYKVFSFKVQTEFYKIDAWSLLGGTNEIAFLTEGPTICAYCEPLQLLSLISSN